MQLIDCPKIAIVVGFYGKFCKNTSTSPSTSNGKEADGGLVHNDTHSTDKGMSMKKRARPDSEKKLACSFSHSSALFDIINVSEKREQINAYRRDAQL